MKRVSLEKVLLLVSLLGLLAGPFNVSGQPQHGGVPLSFGRAIGDADLTTHIIPAPSEDALSSSARNGSLPYCFAINVPVDFTTANSGNTSILSDGQRVWRLSLRSQGAKALILYFDRFSIPEGGRLFVYNPARTLLFGAYTRANNNSFGTFACPLVEGESVILEYNAPEEVPPPDIHLSEAAYAFRGVPGLENGASPATAGKCEVNINCPEGAAWQDQKRGVVKIIVKDSIGRSVHCSGSIVNNTSENGIPYLLTANHCGRYSRPVELSQWLFYFNYEVPGCPNTLAPTTITMLGAEFRAAGGTELTGSDFYLVRLSENISDSLHVFFNGWDRQDVPSPQGTGIHHPAGDIKKISTYTTPLVTAHWPGNPNPCHWQVFWSETPNGHGVTEGGSSGSPIFSNEGLIAGTLTGGDSGCDSNSLNLPDYYGKFSWGWDHDLTDSTTNLKYWLDPGNTGVLKFPGRFVGIRGATATGNIGLFPNPAGRLATLDLTSLPDGGRDCRVRITDLLGNTCQQRSADGNGKLILDLGSLSAGIYFVVVSGPGYSKSLKLVKM